MRMVVVTGMSGAGRTSALKAFEDNGYDALDNLPLHLLPMLVESSDALPQDRPLALGIDIRARDFTPETFLSKFLALKQAKGRDITLLFLDCNDDMLVRRFSETRRRHPLAQDRTVQDGIQQERGLIRPLLEHADQLLDTSDCSLTDLRREIGQRFGLDAPELTIEVVSFAFRRGLPRVADLVFDVRFLRNPHYVPALQPLTGLDAGVGAYIEQDEHFAPLLTHLQALLSVMLAGYEKESKSYLTIAFGCTGGQHRSVFMAERVGDMLQREKRHVKVRHRDIPQTM